MKPSSEPVSCQDLALPEEIDSLGEVLKEILRSQEFTRREVAALISRSGDYFRNRVSVMVEDLRDRQRFLDRNIEYRDSTASEPQSYAWPDTKWHDGQAWHYWPPPGYSD